MKKGLEKITLLGFVIMLALSTNNVKAEDASTHLDKSFIQNYSIKYALTDNSIKLENIVSDRNGYIQILSSKGLMRPRDGQFLFPGTILTDKQDRPTSDKKIAAIATYDNQLVYLDDKAVLSNGWAGKLYSRHTMPGAHLFAGGNDFTFLISDGTRLNLLKDSHILWEQTLTNDEMISLPKKQS